jgi:hypothetical protein
VTNIARGSAEWLYDTVYCERGQSYVGNWVMAE